MTGLKQAAARSATRLPAVPDPLTPLPYSVRVQQFAAHVAVLRGREPGALFRGTKVTAIQ
jgi:hypothetical protein